MSRVDVEVLREPWKRDVSRSISAFEINGGVLACMQGKNALLWLFPILSQVRFIPSN